MFVVFVNLYSGSSCPLLCDNRRCDGALIALTDVLYLCLRGILTFLNISTVSACTLIRIIDRVTANRFGICEELLVEVLCCCRCYLTVIDMRLFTRPILGAPLWTRLC